MVNVAITTTSSHSIQINNLTTEQVYALKTMVQNPPNGMDPDQESEWHKELRKAIWEACKHIYP